MEKRGLKDRTINELRAEARKKGIPLLRSMKKKDILRALQKKRKAPKAPVKKAASATGPRTGLKTKKPVAPKTPERPTALRKTETATGKKGARKTPGRLLRKDNSPERPMTQVHSVRGKPQKTGSPPAKTPPEREVNPPLPEEYGENDLFLIAVDPDVVYASWEIRREDLPARQTLTMRLFDVTEAGPGGRPERVMDIAISQRAGSGFFELKLHGRDVVAEIGPLKEGRFRPVLRSNMVSFPVPIRDHESGGSEPSEPGTPTGY
jgi:hypothetical protein